MFFCFCSVNVELAATVGIHSDKPRPDYKIVTHVHSESHIEAQFKIKDSHVGLVKVSVPSENIAYTKIRYLKLLLKNFLFNI